MEVNANHIMFPEDWLFRWRWSKGKKQARGRKATDDAGEDEEQLTELKPKDKKFLPLVSALLPDTLSECSRFEADTSEQPDGKPATIEFIEVGGRTSAVVTELQKMPQGVEIKPKITKGKKGKKGKGKGKEEDDSVSHPVSLKGSFLPTESR